MQITEDTVVSQNLKVFASWRGPIEPDPFDVDLNEDIDPDFNDGSDTPIVDQVPGGWY